MERIEYDPEIDPTIREEREAFERERDLSARIRIEIERYVEENDLVPREQKERQEAGSDEPPWYTDDEADEGNGREASASKIRRETERKKEETEKEQKRQEKARKRTARATETRKAIGSVFTGSILSSEWVRRMLPYLLGIATLLVLYIAHTFHLQKLHLERQALERQVRELGIESLARTAERVHQTRRSAIVERLAEKGIPLEEFPHPVKTIENR